MASVVHFHNGTAVIYPERLFGDMGVVGRWTRTVSTELERSIKAAAPRRTGFLKAGISVSDTRSGGMSRNLVVRSHAEYSKYVLYGTEGQVVEKTFNMPAWGRYKEWRVKPGRFLAGQEANDFIGQGIEALAPIHPALRGLRSVDAF